MANNTFYAYMITIQRVRPFSSFAPLLKSGSSKRWLNRQNNDFWTQQAKAQNLRSRAAFKLKQIHHQFRIFRPGMTVVDLGFAPGSWSQIAAHYTKPHGKVVGVDLLPVQPPEGVSALQGNFLDQSTKDRLMGVLQQPMTGRRRIPPPICLTEQEVEQQNQKHKKELERVALAQSEAEKPENDVQTVDVVLSDMCGIFPQTSGFWIASINIVYERLANTSGLIARDHAQSIELCNAALDFAVEVLKPGGSFVCKFYTGDEDHILENRLKKLFKLVKRMKPEACRSESREMYFVAKTKYKTKA